MRLSLRSLTLLALPAVFAATAPARAAAPACTAPAPVPAEWSGWEAPEAAAEGGELVPGIAYTVTLAPLAQVPLTGFAAADLPEGSRGAVFTLAVPQTGTWSITVADPMWIDVIGPEGAASAVIESSGHGHGPDCSGIGKIVDFPLTEGTYRIELSAAQVPESRLMIKAP